ncbi:MAG TPA: squalene--hopene cyclase [Candidatus Binataceae bacterium]|jgi:squalene-hopene/tetraprenyl-beta-curcumene cyclase|nr:squalene--hopene cyclase [Candidatus Binataceae bacterium]
MSETIQIESVVPQPEVTNGQLGLRLDQVISRAQQSLLKLQKPEGYWHAPLEANAEMNSEYIIFTHFMDCVDPQEETKLKKLLLELQQPDGSWNLFPGGEGYLSTSIEAYFALKLAGMRAGDEEMSQARRWILSRGGVAKCGSLARFYLAAMGQLPWEATSAVPIEFCLLPNWFPVNVYELSSWARGTVFGLMLLQATRPSVKVSYEAGVLELYIEPPHFTRFRPPAAKSRWSLRGLFNLADPLLRAYNRHPIQGLHARALSAAENWLLEHQEANGSWGGIEPCYLLSAMALKALGYRADHPVLKKALEASRELMWYMGDKTLYMPCVSTNWDTALAAKALLESGLSPADPALGAAARWLIEHQIFKRGDWSVKRPKLEPGGWAFEFYNDWYPDVDDSAVILCDLAAIPYGDAAAREKAIKAGSNWVMGMQSGDGGFAAFDADNHSTWLNHLPFADVEAVTDPSCPDLTGRALEMMAAVGYRADHPVARRAIAWLKNAQDADGSWWGRWGVNYIYGTFSVLAGLRAIGIDPSQDWIRRALQWLKEHQNPDGGWGESPLSDKDRAWRGRGTSTASQTAWALIGLLAGEDAVSDNVTRGVDWLAERQSEDGTWEETEFTGTGFPNHFYLRYYMYPHYFPLMALGRFRARLREKSAG